MLGDLVGCAAAARRLRSLLGVDMIRDVLDAAQGELGNPESETPVMADLLAVEDVDLIDVYVVMQHGKNLLVGRNSSAST